MDEPLVVGIREIKRVFLEDRHSPLVLAMVLQRLASASEPFYVENNSVQAGLKSVAEQPHFEEVMR